MYKCMICNRNFNNPQSYREDHGETVAICPHCRSSEFQKWNAKIEKDEVAQTVLNVIAALNRLQNNIADVFGNNFKNEDLEFAQELCAEFIEEMYDEFISLSTSNVMRKVTSTTEVNRVLMRLEG